MKSPARGEYLIRRVDHHFFHGWHVDITRRGRTIEKYLSDKPGGAAASLRRARAFRDALLANLPPPTKVHRTNVLNKTGIIGVSLSRERTRKGTLLVRYIASWQTRDGRKGKASFSVAKYGKSEARRLAIQARHDALRREGIDVSLIPPTGKGWKRAPQQRSR